MEMFHFCFSWPPIKVIPVGCNVKIFRTPTESECGRDVENTGGNLIQRMSSGAIMAAETLPDGSKGGFNSQ